MASKTGKVGFVGGMDIPLIRSFALGYEEGAQVRQPEDRGLPEHDRHHAGRLERSDAGRRAGAEPVRPRRRRRLRRRRRRPASACSRRPRTRGKLAIGVDSNQNHIHPGTILTSMIKRVDLAVYEAFKTAKDGTWKPGVAQSRRRRGRRRLLARPVQPEADHARDGAAARAGARRHRGRQDQGHRLHGEVVRRGHAPFRLLGARPTRRLRAAGLPPGSPPAPRQRPPGIGTPAAAGRQRPAPPAAHRH